MLRSEDSRSRALLEPGRGGAQPTPQPFRPLAIDLYCGLGGWTEALLAEGWRVIGFDIERHDYGTGTYPGELVLQDVRTLHGAQFRDAGLIVASPPCQFFSRMAMPFKCPWKREEFERRRNLAHDLFWACFRIQSEASGAARREIPMIVENVCGAQKWIGEARWHFGSFYLWGDVPALMPRGSGLDGQKGFSHSGMRRPDWPHNSIGGSLAAKIPYPLAEHVARVFKPHAPRCQKGRSPRTFEGLIGNVREEVRFQSEMLKSEDSGFCEPGRGGGER